MAAPAGERENLHEAPGYVVLLIKQEFFLSVMP